jgi:hypothetical protein
MLAAWSVLTEHPTTETAFKAGRLQFRPYYHCSGATGRTRKVPIDDRRPGCSMARRLFRLGRAILDPFTKLPGELIMRQRRLCAAIAGVPATEDELVFRDVVD